MQGRGRPWGGRVPVPGAPPQPRPSGALTPVLSVEPTVASSLSHSICFCSWPAVCSEPVSLCHLLLENLPPALPALGSLLGHLLCS